MENKCNSKILCSHAKNKSVIYQVSLLQGLTYGDYYGSVSVDEFKQRGDVGIGTFNRLNGELIMLDGNVYRAGGDGNISIVYDDTIPFAVATFFNTDESKVFNNIQSFDSLVNELDKIVDERGKNRFYMIRIDGLFKQINVRSVYEQNEPYRTLVKVLEKDQTFFDYSNTEGTVVGLYCPPYMSSLNAVGWHMHFISKDKTKGGHVLGLNIANAKLSLCDIDSFELKLPKNQMFAGFDLTVDLSKDIEKIEKSK